MKTGIHQEIITIEESSKQKIEDFFVCNQFFLYNSSPKKGYTFKHSGNYINHLFELKREEVTRSYNIENNKHEKQVDKLHKIKTMIKVMFVNGILTSKRKCLYIAEELLDILEIKKIIAMHNSSDGIFADLKEWYKGVAYPKNLNVLGPIMTPPVVEIAHRIKAYFAKSPLGSIIIIAHSQGCLHVLNAVREISPVQRSNVYVINVGPALGAYLSMDICRNAVNITSRLDPIGYFATIFGKKNVVRVKADPRAHWFDHDFLSPTYIPVIKEKYQIAIANAKQKMYKSDFMVHTTITERGEIMMSKTISKLEDSIKSWIARQDREGEYHFKDCLSKLHYDDIVPLRDSFKALQKHYLDIVEEDSRNKICELSSGKILPISMACSGFALSSAAVIGACVFPPTSILTFPALAWTFGVGSGTIGTSYWYKKLTTKEDETTVSRFFTEAKQTVKNTFDKAESLIKIKEIKYFSEEQSKVCLENANVLKKSAALEKRVERVENALSQFLIY